MSHRTLNLRVLAHVDAGKTTLTQQLLHAASVIEQVGSVDAGTIQTDRLQLEVPTGTIATIVPALAKRGAAIEVCSTRGSLSTIEVLVAAARAHELQRDLPALTGGEGVLESEFAGYRPVVGPPPRRRATGS